MKRDDKPLPEPMPVCEACGRRDFRSNAVWELLFEASPTDWVEGGSIWNIPKHWHKEIRLYCVHDGTELSPSQTQRIINVWLAVR